MLVENLQVEITSHCNSFCGGCIRNNQGGERVVPLHHMPVSTFKKINFDKIKQMTFNGAYGEPTMHPEALDIFSNIPNHVIWNITSNGGARSEYWWKDLAKMQYDSCNVVFSIDGLKDTNHLYRRNVNFEKIMKNAAAFISAGGNAYWKFISFKHNEHQIEEASNIAKQMGFKRFDVDQSYADEIYQKEYKGFPETKVHKGRVTDKYNFKVSFKKKKTWPRFEKNLGCGWKNSNRAQLDAWGNIWRCCFHVGFHTQPHYKELLLFDMKNDLNKYSYDDIINSTFFEDIFDPVISSCLECPEYV